MTKIRNIFKRHIILLLFISVLNSNAQNVFIQNKGQFPKQVQAKVNLPSGALFIEQGSLIYSFYSQEQLAAVHDLSRTNKKIDAHSYVMDFINSNTDVSIELLEESKYYENYFVGDKSKWAANVRSYKSLYQKNVYNGVDVEYYIDKDKLKYDIILSPHTSPKKIKLKYTGLNKIRLNTGDVYFTTTVNTVKERQQYA